MSPKKRILIVDKSFAFGGIQTSLLNLTAALKDCYEFDILVFHNAGGLKARVPEGVRVITPSFQVRLHGMGVRDALQTKNPFIIVPRLLYGVSDKLFGNRLSFAFSLFFQPILKGYDVAIAFHHEDSRKATVSGFYRFVLNRTDAPLKLGWIHYDPRHISFDDRVNLSLMKQMDRIVCVSKSCAEIFAQRYPDLTDKIAYAYNFHDIDRVLQLSDSPPLMPMDSDAFCCFSACRLTKEKAIDRAVCAFAEALHRFQDVKWYIAGEGPERENIEQMIAKYNLSEQIILLGATENPYAYMKRSDLYLQVSQHEAAPMVFGEAAICKVPILATNTTSAKELIFPGCGIVCENTEEALRTTFTYLLEHREHIASLKAAYEQKRFSNSLAAESFSLLIKNI